MRILLSFLIIFYSSLLFAQQNADTIFYNAEWRKCASDQAVYYRLFEREGEKMMVKDFYRNGVLQMKAEALEPFKPDSVVLHGKAIYYHANGKRASVGNYKNNEKIGEWIWYNEKGRFKNSETYYDPNYVAYKKESWAPQNQASRIIANVGYRYKLNRGTINSGHGLSIELGINFGYFISQKLLLAPFIGYGFRDVFYNTAFNSAYVNDFNSSLDMSELSHNDSLVVLQYKRMINSKGYLHERLGYFGLMLKLPYKYFPIIKVYTGSLSHAFKTGSEVLYLDPPPAQHQNRTDNDYFDIGKRLRFGTEIYLFPGFSRVKEYEAEQYKVDGSSKKCYHVYFCTLSVYFESIDASRASFAYYDGLHDVNVPLSRVLNGDFLKKYKSEYNLGIRLSFGLF